MKKALRCLIPAMTLINALTTRSHTFFNNLFIFCHIISCNYFNLIPCKINTHIIWAASFLVTHIAYLTTQQKPPTTNSFVSPLFPYFPRGLALTTMECHGYNGTKKPFHQLRIYHKQNLYKRIHSARV